jgi:hypothetical protein
MKISKLTKSVIALLILAGSINFASAQEKEAQKEAPKPSLVDISGVLFLDYSYLMESKEKVADTKTEKKHAFNLNRVYLTFNKKIDDMWSAKVTLDAGSVDGSNAFVKNAYVQMANNFGAADLKVQAGLVGTPIIGLIDGLNGSRWIYQNYIDKAEDIIGQGIDVSSADTGVKADLNIMKMVNVTGMYSNADGYKVKTQDQDNTTKSLYSVVNVTPFSALNIFGYYHWHDTAGKNSENYVSYIGGGVAWSDKTIKFGAAYTIRSGKAADIKEESKIMEFWANVNLQEFTNMPVLLIGRYAMGTYEKKATTKLENKGSAMWIGAGYQVNSNVQLALMYKANTLSKKSAGVKTSDLDESTLFAKSEIKF